MNAVQKVKEICRSRKIPISRLERDLGFANGYISQLRKGTFPNDRLVQISGYLNVPTEYLTGEEEQKESPTTQTGSEALKDAGYYKLNEENKALIDQMIAQLIKSQSGN